MFFKGETAKQQQKAQQNQAQQQENFAIQQQYGNQQPQYQPYPQQQQQYPQVQQPQQQGQWQGNQYPPQQYQQQQPYQQKLPPINQNFGYNQFPSNQKPIENQQDYEQQRQQQPVYINNKQNNVDNFQIEQTSSLNLSDDVIRKGFIKKVLLIIAFQMLITFFFCLIATTNQGYRDFTRKNIWLLVICLIISFVVLIILYCFRKHAKEVPKNYILLFLYTFCESYLISCICSVVNPSVVLMASGILFLIVICITIYAVKTKNDITTKIAFFIWAPFALIVLVLVGAIWSNHIVSTIISLIIILFFCAYLVFDIQRLTNSQNNKYTYDYDDYIIAALDIYIDIISIFQELISLLS